MSQIDNSEWYALVKYKSGNQTEVLPVHKIKIKIKKSEWKAFNPKSLTDFDKTKFYTVYTEHGSEDGKEHKWYALIGLLAESREALEHAMSTKRVSWPIMLHESESEPNSTDTALEQSPSNVTITSNRDWNRNKKKMKKNATDAFDAKLLASRSLNPSDASVSVTGEDIVTRLLQENKELKAILKAERKRNNESEGVIDYIDILQRIEKKVEKMQNSFKKKFDSAENMNFNKLLELEIKMANIEDSIRTRPPLSSASSTISTNEDLLHTEEKVPLGDGVFCSKAAYNKLINVEESHADWAYALLKGVFGEKAHLMRVRLNSKHAENERFPSNFLMVAKSLHRDWLLKQKIQDKNGQLHAKYSATEVEKYVNTLPAYLADRAYDMLGPRGANARKGDENLAPKRKRSGSTEPKRKYTRRGQLLLERQEQSQQPNIQQQPLLQQQPQQQYEEPYQQPLPQQEPLQLSLQHQSFDNHYLSRHFISPPISEAVTFENPKTIAATFTTL